MPHRLKSVPQVTAQTLKPGTITVRAGEEGTMFRLLPGICDIVPLRRSEGESGARRKKSGSKLPHSKKRPGLPGLKHRDVPVKETGIQKTYEKRGRPATTTAGRPPHNSGVAIRKGRAEARPYNVAGAGERAALKARRKCAETLKKGSCWKELELAREEWRRHPKPRRRA